MYNSIDISQPKDKTPYLWKFFDLHRFIYLLTEKKLFFTRLDKLEDPFEGVATKFLRRDAEFADVPTKFSDFDKSVPLTERRRLLNEKKLHEYAKQTEVQKAQTTQYVNCWFASDRESMAMWNLYSNKDSVAVKVNFKKLKKQLKNSFDDFQISRRYGTNIIGEQITYLKLNPFDVLTPKQTMKYTALKKDISFQYEQEYRFLIVSKKISKPELFFEIPFDIQKIEMTIVTHPNMEDWKFQNLKAMLKILKVEINMERSATILKKENFG